MLDRFCRAAAACLRSVLAIPPRRARDDPRQSIPEERSTEAPGELAAYKVVYDEAVRTIEAQRQSLDELRSRAGILIGAAALIAGFFGPAALKPGTPPNLAIGAGVLMVLAVAPVVFVLLPLGGWRFSNGTRNLLQDYVEGDNPATMSEIYRSLAWFIEDDWESNRKRLLARYALFTVSALALVGETIAWLVTIASTPIVPTP